MTVLQWSTVLKSQNHVVAGSQLSSWIGIGQQAAYPDSNSCLLVGDLVERSGAPFLCGLKTWLLISRKSKKLDAFDSWKNNDTFPGVINYIRVKFLRMSVLTLSDKCKLINVKRNAKHLWYKYNGLFVRTYNILTFQQSYLSQIDISLVSLNRLSVGCGNDAEKSWGV